MSRTTRDAADIRQWIRARVAKQLGVPPDAVDPTHPFDSYGLDSIKGFTLTCDLADWLNVDLPAELLWEYPTIADLAQHLAASQSSTA